MKASLSTQLQTLFKQWAGQTAAELKALPASGSNRRYFRMRTAQHQALAVHHTSESENKAFIQYTKHFEQIGIAVPKIYATNLEASIYLIEDLGDCTLLQHLQAHKTTDGIAEPTIHYYKQALKQLVQLQLKGAEGLAVEQHHQPDHFSRQAMLWDLYYFKYCFLKTETIAVDEALLEQDFQVLVDRLAAVPQDTFMMRDFQARNIMLHEDQTYFIDYQGGKKGPLQYDVVSLLFQAKAALSPTLRLQLLNYYIDCLEAEQQLDRAAFMAHFYDFVLLRSLQVLGAYGFKGRYEQKEHFLSSIPFAFKNIAWLLENSSLQTALPYLSGLLQTLIAAQTPTIDTTSSETKSLTITVQSFSYKKGIPKDQSGNGGGFVFDCRFIHNPGRYTPYKHLTGRDESVKDFFKKESKIDDFVEQTIAMVKPAVERYLERGFTHLSVNFGCTGGQHRSVFCADAMANYLETHYPVNVRLWHREQERKQWVN